MLALRQAVLCRGRTMATLTPSAAAVATSALRAAHPVRLQSTAAAAGPASNLLLRQLFDADTFTYTYLVADRRSGEAALIDPVIDQVDRDLTLLRDLRLKLKYAVNTHMHADHVTGSGLIKAALPDCQSVISAASGAQADVLLAPGDRLRVGELELETRATPGHTNGCVTYVLHAAGLAFTGDAVLIRGCGRTDFQEGDSATLYDSVHSQVFSLPEHFTVLPAHDYHGLTSSSIAEEKHLNPRLSLPKAEFVKFMEGLKLDYPKRIDEALPANRACGLQELSEAHRALFDRLSTA
ncbi:persulfide dioxygenase ETHE1, mitochondrial-like isoform X2 [Pollicipes pollicipes]|nr:persulfide dioxygenase ETHE1, mitochondrial-like isoform X2 [Pollicipes pollicipes]XP_037080380.1 persulfide dioxygenase ETHE1, mitochondrial-like isoform X2 [Pollicipes pollicipes]XP_037080382.1 persulfide dioxygenase ETHE1, mitochondrial-like isoform X2 [Pollicipes pollicipes]XP_037080383.1 persulfide dioxygenase ETHE1, mitochondrial-like isoform X2 [Pollicipes pollicipes]